jgi:uncharacterized protein
MLHYHSTKQHIKVKNRLQPFIITLVVICMCLAHPSVQAQTVANKPGIFYAVTGNGLKDTSWLFGTYHLVKSSYLDGLPVVKKAFDKAKGVVVEIIMDESSQQLAQKASLLQNNTLKSLLDKPFADSLDAELKAELGAGIDQLNQLKPISVMLTLSMVYATKYNDSQIAKYTGLPLDLNFVAEGKKSGKDIGALETLASQMDLLFNTLTEAAQVSTLKVFLRNKKMAQQEGNELLAAWFKQDLDRLYKVIERSRTLYGMGDTDYYYLMNDARNINWMKKLPGLLAQQSQFVAVGALHLMGPNGLVEQLRKQGYTVTPIK